MNEIHSTKRVLGKVIAKTCNVHGKSEQKFQATNKRIHCFVFQQL
jgi:hypothetical protein